MIGKVYLVGAGPGDPELLTLKACELLMACDVVVHDALVNPAVLRYVPANAERIFVGKPRNTDRLCQHDVARLLIDKARAGKLVVRLKGGDPFLFGRGGEEADALVNAGIPWEVVPGVSAGLAVPAFAGIPVTDRRYASSVAFVTGHSSAATEHPVDWSALAHAVDTLVIFMGVRELPRIVAALLQAGKPESTPIALLERGTTADQRTRVGTLGSIVDVVQHDPMVTPALIVIGDVVRCHHRLAWFEDQHHELLSGVS